MDFCFKLVPLLLRASDLAFWCLRMFVPVFFLWWSLATGALPSCRSGPLPTAALMMVSDAGNLPLFRLQCGALSLIWMGVRMHRWTDGAQLKSGHRSQVCQSQITNMQIIRLLKDYAENVLMRVKGALSDLGRLTYQPLSGTKDINRCLARLTVSCNRHK